MASIPDGAVVFHTEDFRDLPRDEALSRFWTARMFGRRLIAMIPREETFAEALISMIPEIRIDEGETPVTHEVVRTASLSPGDWSNN